MQTHRWADNFHDYMNVHKKTSIYETVEWTDNRVLEINGIRTIHTEIGFPEIKNMIMIEKMQ
jgi:hypothetical protein